MAGTFCTAHGFKEGGCMVCGPTGFPDGSTRPSRLEDYYTRCPGCNSATPRGSLVPNHTPGCPIGTPTGRISWRDTLGVWPSLSVMVHLLPWHWTRWWFWSDDIERWWHLYAGPVEIQFGWNRGVFPLERRVKED